MDEEADVVQNSRMNVTGKNFLFALLIALTVTLILAVIYSLMALVLDLCKNENIDVWAIVTNLSSGFLQMLKAVGMCAVPIVFLIAFALLQRFRMKN